MNRVLLFSIAAILLISACTPKQKTKEQNTGPHKVEVLEVLQANAYTYLNVNENRNQQWIAVPKMEAHVGDIYYFDTFMEMNDFKSKDLDRTFESVYFIQEIRAEEDAHAGHDHSAHGAMPQGHPEIGQQKHEGKPLANQKEINVKPAEGGITVAELFANRDKYDGKTVLIKGEVVKANFEIMNMNWFHIQDGTADGDNFDLTITSIEKNVKAGDVLTFEGVIILNKDFGYGYSYEVIMEDAVIK